MSTRKNIADNFVDIMRTMTAMVLPSTDTHGYKLGFDTVMHKIYSACLLGSMSIFIHRNHPIPHWIVARLIKLGYHVKSDVFSVEISWKTPCLEYAVPPGGGDIAVDRQRQAKLYRDCRDDIERSEFFRSGRAHETGIVAHAIQADVADAFYAKAFVGEPAYPKRHTNTTEA